MSRITLNWNGEFSAELEPALNAGINRAMIWSAREMREGSSKVYPGVQRKVSKKTGRVYWKGPGAPRGQYPGLRSGQLTASMSFEPAKDLRGRIGASVKYADHVHRDRPFITLTFQRNARAIQSQFEKGVQFKLNKMGGV